MRNLSPSIAAHTRLFDTCLAPISTAADALVLAYLASHKVVFFGNGGSAADVPHLAAEFLGRYLRARRPLPAVALNANSSAIMAIANHYGYSQVFARQLEAIAAPGDIAVVIKILRSKIVNRNSGRRSPFCGG